LTYVEGFGASGLRFLGFPIPATVSRFDLFSTNQELQQWRNQG